MHAFLMIAIGVIAHFLFDAVFNKAFNVTLSGKVSGLGLVVAGVCTYFINKMNLNGWLVDAALVGGGFILCFLVVKLASIIIS